MKRLFSVLIAVSALLSFTLSAAESPDYRIPAAMNVTSQSVELRLDPDQDGYMGTTTLALTLDAPLASLALHWIDLEVTSIELTGASGTRTLTAKAGDWDMFWLSDGDNIAAGTYELSLSFRGDYSTDALGMYKATEGEENYLFTQYEMTLARRTFPLVDEPDTKIPWNVTLSAPARFKVAANTPVKSESTEDGWVTRVFETTPPMSSYLLALAVGDFDVTPIEGMGVPGVIYSPKGTGDATGFAVAQTAPILKALESYFGSSYPYKKLDFVAVPNFTFGAMENVGLVTYRTELLLRGDDPSPNAALSTVNVIAHELAHMWYGNLVTMAWWDDLWLNEAFASWMAFKVTNDLYPRYQANLSLPQANAFPADALGATKPIRKEVKTEEDVLDGLGLNYSKGHSILNMLEQSIGEASFQAAIREYMDKHQWGNTVASDLWDALSRHSDYEVGEVAATFLNQAGYPLIRIAEDGTISQQRFENQGAGLAAQAWQVPLALKIKTANGIEQITLPVGPEGTQSAALAEAEWVLPASNGNGYYVWYTNPSQYAALLDDTDALSDREKAALLTNGNQLLSAGVVDMGQHTALLAAMSEQSNEEIVLKAVEGLRSVAQMYRGSELEPGMSALINTRLSPWYLKLRLSPSEDDNDSALKLRPRVLRTLAEYGNNPEISGAMATLAQNYLENPDSVDAGVGFEALRVNALNNGDLDLAKTYVSNYSSTDNATLKSQLRSALYFSDPEAIEHVLKALADGTVVSGDIASALSGLFYANSDQTALYALFEKHYDDLFENLPEFYRPQIPQIASAGCSAGNVELQKIFFAARGDLLATSLSKAQESAGNCVAKSARGTESLKAYLEAQ